MASVAEKKEHNLVELTIEISKDDFNEAMNRAFRKNAGRFSIPGFRKGKAPIGMVKRYYGEGVLYDDAIDECVNPAYSEAVKEHRLEPVSRPELEIESIGSDKGLKAKISVINKPEVQLGQYKGVEAVRPEAEVTDEAVEAELKRIQERNARMVPVDDRAAAAGDTVNIDYEGLKDGVAFEGGTAEHHDLVIGSGSFIPGFEDQIIGHMPGDDFDVSLSFPADYHAEDLAGQAVVFKVHLHSIKVKEMPELDDEFAKDISEFDTIAEYRDDIRRDLTEKAEASADRTFENNAVKAATDLATIDLPSVMVDNEVDQMYRQQEEQMRGMGFGLDQYLGYLGQSEADFRAQLRPDAEARVRASLVLEAVANAEAIEVTEADREAELLKMADQYGTDIERLREIFGAESSMMDGDIKIRKAVQLIKDAAHPIAPPAEPAADEAADDEPAADEAAADAE